jgi:hypothetical protein
MNINDIHNVILFYLNKAQQGFVTHQEIDEVLDRAQMTLFDQYHTNPKQAVNAPVENYGNSQRIDDALSPFKQKYTFNSIATPSGVITLPVNYQHLIALYTSVYNSQLGRNVYSAVQVLAEDELIERLESQVIPISADDPVAIMNSNNLIQLFPEVASTGAVYYFKRPAVPVFGYTQVGRAITYNPLTSTQLEWRDQDINNIIVIALQYYGLNMKSQDIMQFGQVKEAQGQ